MNAKNNFWKRMLRIWVFAALAVLCMPALAAKASTVIYGNAFEVKMYECHPSSLKIFCTPGVLPCVQTFPVMILSSCITYLDTVYTYSWIVYIQGCTMPV